MPTWRKKPRARNCWCAYDPRLKPWPRRLLADDERSLSSLVEKLLFGLSEKARLSQVASLMTTKEQSSSKKSCSGRARFKNRVIERLFGWWRTPSDRFAGLIAVFTFLLFLATCALSSDPSAPLQQRGQMGTSFDTEFCEGPMELLLHASFRHPGSTRDFLVAQSCTGEIGYFTLPCIVMAGNNPRCCIRWLLYVSVGCVQGTCREGCSASDRRSPGDVWTFRFRRDLFCCRLGCRTIG
jgi:hypothetical protein